MTSRKPILRFHLSRRNRIAAFGSKQAATRLTIMDARRHDFAQRPPPSE